MPRRCSDRDAAALPRSCRGLGVPGRIVHHSGFLLATTRARCCASAASRTPTRVVRSGDDADALQRLTETRDVPTLMIGVQGIQGFEPQAWNGYLTRPAVRSGPCAGRL